MKCKDCRFREEDYLTALNGRGIYRFSYCQRLVHDCRVVDPDIDRGCQDFKEKLCDEGTREDATSDTEATGRNEA